jgi:signal peptide peptidase SppA
MSESTAVVNAFLGDPDKVWAMRESAFRAILAIRDDELLDARARVEPYVPPTATKREGVTRIPIVGPITRRPQRGLMAMLLGGATSVEDVRHDLRAALADPSVSQIVLHVDSPGGETDGITELAAELYEARARKPIVSFVDSMAASAGYWLASQASEVIVTPSGSVGSIGVFALHLDRSRALDADGITPTFVQAGKFKTEESPLHPLSDDARAEVQARVAAFYAMFTRDVARGRGVSVETVRTRFGEGRMVLARDAVKLGMADEVATRDRAMRRRAANAQATAAIREAAEVEAASPISAYTYIETRYGGSCEVIARDAFKMAALDLGLHGREPDLRFFRAEDDRDRLLDQTSPRMRRAEHEWAVTFPDRQGGRGEVWVNAAIVDPDFMRHVVRHEVRHMVQSRTLVDEAAEVDAERYATDRTSLIDQLYGGARRAS